MSANTPVLISRSERIVIESKNDAWAFIIVGLIAKLCVLDPLGLPWFPIALVVGMMVLLYGNAQEGIILVLLALICDSLYRFFGYSLLLESQS